MKNAASREICMKCAECCKHYPFVELSPNEINTLEKFTGLRFDVFANSKGKAAKEYFLKFKKNGDCFFLNENDGHCSCGVYDARSGVCRNYPSNPTQNNVCDANRKICLSKSSG